MSAVRMCDEGASAEWLRLRAAVAVAVADEDEDEDEGRA